MATPAPPPAPPPPGVLPGQSPLKQVNQAGAPKPKSKLEASWLEWATNPQLFAGPDSPSPARYFADFFCLKPQVKVENEALAKLGDADLAGPYKNNVAQLFVNAVKVLKESEKDDVSRSNVIETLIPLLRNLLARKFDNYSFTVRTLLAGSLEKSDQVFGDLVATIDSTLQDTLTPVPLRHRVLQLALVIVASVNQGALNAYFLRRDLFSTLVTFIADEETKQFAFESVLLLGLLANYRKNEARNPYGVRIEDFVEEGVMARIVDVVETACESIRDSYTSLADDTPPSFVTSLTSFLTSFRITEFFTSSFSLPPPPSPAKPAPLPTTTPAPSSPEKGKQKAEDLVKDSAAPPVDAPSSPSTAPPALPEAPQKPSPPSPSTSPAKPPQPAAKPPLRSETSLRPEEAPFVAMPPEMVVLLLPFYELLNSNKTFGSLVFSAGESEEGEPPALPPALISLSSYIVCHASLSVRSRLYSRLSLILLLILVEEGEGKLTPEEEEEIRLCRQRHPMLPPASMTRPISAMIDTVVIFLRHNLRKRLDVETHIIALRLLQRILQQLKTEKVRLDRDWVIVWRSILALSSFVVGRIAELRTISDKVDTLISQIFITLCYAAYWADAILPDPSAQAHLHYELLHADSTLSSLSDLLGISSIASPVVPAPASSSTTSLPTYNRRDTPTRATFFSALSPTRSSFGSLGPPSISPISASSLTSLGGSGSGGTGGGFVATECISSLRSATTFFSSHINQLRLTKPASDDPIEPAEILAVIERNLGGVEMIESAAMGDLRRFAAEGSAGMESYFAELVGVVCEDTLRLMEQGGAA
ncbi:hypothetical protein JCM6882_001364 [Rhodosporidiobolus microsporus]